MPRHPNNIVEGMRRLGLGTEDILDAYPGLSASDLEELWVDIGLSQERPVKPYGLLGITPCRSRFFNFTDAGFRTPGHDQPWPPREDRPTIFVFGGSTTLGFNVGDADTVPAQLEAVLSARGMQVDVYNFGQNSYTARHEMLLLLDLLDKGTRPDVAIFLDGFNDCFYAFGNPGLVRMLDSLYRNEKRRRRMSLFRAALDYAVNVGGERRQAMPDTFSYQIPPPYEGFAAYLSEAGVERALQTADDEASSADDDTIANLVWGNYRRSVSLIEGLASSEEFDTLFAWQPIALYRTRPEQRPLERLHLAFPNATLCGPVYRSIAARDFPGLGRKSNFLDLTRAGDTFDGIAYVDTCHYSKAFAAVIADQLADSLEDVFQRTGPRSVSV